MNGIRAQMNGRRTKKTSLAERAHACVRGVIRAFHVWSPLPGRLSLVRAAEVAKKYCVELDKLAVPFNTIGYFANAIACVATIRAWTHIECTNDDGSKYFVSTEFIVPPDYSTAVSFDENGKPRTSLTDLTISRVGLWTYIAHAGRLVKSLNQNGPEVEIVQVPRPVAYGVRRVTPLRSYERFRAPDGSFPPVQAGVRLAPSSTGIDVTRTLPQRGEEPWLTSDPFDIDPKIIPKGKSYEWKREALFGETDAPHMQRMRRDGWKPVSPKRHKGLVVRHAGMILMERSMKLTSAARQVDFKIATDHAYPVKTHRG